MEYRRFLLTLAVVVMMALATLGDDCKGTVDGYNYDLGPQGKKELTAVENNGGPSSQEYFYIPCNFNSRCVSSADAKPAVCQKDRGGAYWDLGTQPTGQMVTLPTQYGGPGKGFTLEFSGGVGGRKTSIHCVCDQSKTSGKETFDFVTENPTMTYQLLYTTAYACPVKSGGGGGGGGGDDDDGGLAGGWIFIIILSSLLVLYLVGGVAYNKFVAHREGIELIPNVTFWMALPGLVKDGHLFVWRKVRGLTGRGSYEEM